MNVLSALKETVVSLVKPSKSPEKKFPSKILRNVPGECTYCRKILYVIEMPLSDVRDHSTFRIGFIDDVMSSGCKQHTTFLRNYSEELALDEDGGELLMSRYYWTHGFTFYTERGSPHPGGQYTIGTPEMDLLGGIGLGVELDESWIDEETVLGWYERCVEEHGEKCNSPRYLEILPRAEPHYFIDVVENCLVRAPVGASYAALSYVWGQTEMLKATKSNVSRLQEPGALAEAGSLQSLPRTVRHAIYLTRKLKALRYLWVDALCIVQDDEDMFKTHLPQMGSIYGRASIVITGMDGTDANYGLRGLESAPDANPRQLHRDPIAFGGKSFVTRHQMGKYRTTESLSAQSYHSRGWTFQEHFFSRRSICFENDSVWFQCCCKLRYEDHKVPESRHDERDWILDVGYPSNTVMMRVIDNFNVRHLSFPQDCLPAFSGVTACYTKVYTGGFICGLPEMFLDAMLLWQPKGDLTRRVAVTSSTKPVDQTTDICLPSWSWVGWQGSLDCSGWESANNFVASCSGWIGQTRCEIRAGTDWHASKDPNGVNRRHVDASWLHWCAKYKNPGMKLPDGWTKRLNVKKDDPANSDPPEGYGKYIYEFKKSKNPTFWYPLPLGNPNGTPKVDADLPYLFGGVDTVHVYTLGGVSIVERYDSQHPCISLGNESGEWIGMLRLHSLDYFERKGIDPARERVPVQLISISTGFIPNDVEYSYEYVDEYRLKERPVEGTNYEFANVLWISWDGSVARREALGRVELKRWVALEPEHLEIVLG
ncbi:heterokaryon incompatibility protein [Periconia macrospinosa]|uniref:Heterokaryon incompatibility protein n=1 Tax=Periconia macrospinosa TaxID=97972 RepID=A0A2V1DPK2_9PLEO|nr:heterokaryon incompatibility protein [Periconia macrospinosa]